MPGTAAPAWGKESCLPKSWTLCHSHRSTDRCWLEPKLGHYFSLHSTMSCRAVKKWSSWSYAICIILVLPWYKITKKNSLWHRFVHSHIWVNNCGILTFVQFQYSLEKIGASLDDLLLHLHHCSMYLTNIFNMDCVSYPSAMEWSWPRSRFLSLW